MQISGTFAGIQFKVARDVDKDGFMTGLWRWTARILRDRKDPRVGYMTGIEGSSQAAVRAAQEQCGSPNVLRTTAYPAVPF